MVVSRYIWFITAFSFCKCLPPHQRHQSVGTDPRSDSKENDIDSNLDTLGIEYNRYLQQIVEALEKDEHFKKKLEEAKQDDIESAKIADELEFVNHHVRSKLDELKRQELERLRDLAGKLNGKNGFGAVGMGHVDHANPHTFEVQDLKNLIRQAVKDLEEADKKRKENFKDYELEKHYEHEQKLKNMTEGERKKFLQQEEKMKEQEEIAKKKIHHPGSKQQFEEVWENQDHMSKNDFNPRTFFIMHDIDGNGFLDEEEIKALFVRELDKLYDSGTYQRDGVERAEEMERMREHVFNEVDKNKDRLISWDEFYAMSLQSDFNEDPGWQPIQEEEVFSPDEWHAYEQKRLAEDTARNHNMPNPNSNIYYDANGHPQTYYQQPIAHPIPATGNPQQQGAPEGVPQNVAQQQAASLRISQQYAQQGIQQQSVMQQQPAVMYQNEIPPGSLPQTSGQVSFVPPQQQFQVQQQPPVYQPNQYAIPHHQQPQYVVPQQLPQNQKIQSTNQNYDNQQNQANHVNEQKTEQRKQSI